MASRVRFYERTDYLGFFGNGTVFAVGIFVIDAIRVGCFNGSFLKGPRERSRAVLRFGAIGTRLDTSSDWMR